jgi:hypothetical protein
LATLSMRSRTELMFQVVTVNRIGIGNQCSWQSGIRTRLPHL